MSCPHARLTLAILTAAADAAMEGQLKACDTTESTPGMADGFMGLTEDDLITATLGQRVASR